MTHRLPPESYHRTSLILPSNQFMKTSSTHRLLIFLLIAILWASSVLLIGALPAGAVQYKIKTVPINNVSGDDIMINDKGDIVWIGNDIYNNTQIYSYSNNKVEEISNNNYRKYLLNINDNGNIVWSEQVGDEVSYDYQIISYYNRSTNIILNAGRLDDCGSIDINNNGKLVWSVSYDINGRNGIYLYDINTNEPPIRLTNNADQGVKINNINQIVWSRYSNYDIDIYLYDKSIDSNPINLTNTPNFDEGSWGSPARTNAWINDNSQIVFPRSNIDGGYLYDIFLYDKTMSLNPINLTNSPNQISTLPIISNSGIIVCSDSIFSGIGKGLYFININLADKTKKVIGAALYQNKPDINDYGLLVWKSSFDIYRDIYLYDCVNEKGSINISNRGNSPLTFGNPKINNTGTIAWVSRNSNTQECFLNIAAPQNEVAKYDYFYFYNLGNGDYYIGSVYATQDIGYFNGWYKIDQDEDGQYGVYWIYNTVENAAQGDMAGKVFVDWYFDKETGNYYKPAYSGSPVAGQYLGTETAYINKSGVENYFFGVRDGIHYEADVSKINLYFFGYIYLNSGDYYYGLVCEPAETGYYTNLQKVITDGQSTPIGVYWIIQSYDNAIETNLAWLAGNVMIYGYHDGDTGKDSDTLYPNRSGKKAHQVLSITKNQGLGSEAGYVYDPSVPDDDAYFGNADICYDFSPYSSEGNNFLAVYIPDLPYWDQPLALAQETGGVCQAVAGATLMAYWYQKGYIRLFEGYGLNINEKELWEDNTTDSGYDRLIKTLYYDYDLDQWSTTWGDLERYIDDRGYDFKRNGELFFEKWDDLKRTLDKKEPVIVLLNNGNDFGHAVVGRGYWKDNRVLCSMGWGSDRAETVKGDKMTNMPFKWGEKATFTRVVKDEIQNFLEVEITGVVYFEPE